MNSEELIRLLQTELANFLATFGEVDMLDERELAAALAQYDELLVTFGIRLQDVFTEELIVTYFSGVQQANLLLAQAGAVAAGGAVFTEAGKVARAYQTRRHLSAVENLVTDSMGDLQAAIRTARMSGNQAIQKTLAEVGDNITRGTFRGNTRKAIQAKVMQTFLDDGMTSFITSDNRRLPLDFYAQTVVRTKSRVAAVEGSANRYADSGNDLVIITGNGDSCATCSTYNGMVVSLTGETEGYPVIGQNGVRLPPFHPNCRCGVRPFLVRYATPEEAERAKRRNDAYEPGKDMRTTSQKRAYENEQQERRKANAERKQYMHWVEILGADAPKTLGAFRRMKRGNTLKFQELQSLLRSRSAELSHERRKVGV